jgi:penicillin amidase
MKKLLVRSLLGVAALVVALVLYLWIPIARAGAGLPEWDGVATLEGLEAEVTVTRSEYGTPFIEAETQADLYFAQGFVHAQDRFWQMAVGRRAAVGRLSEWLGAAALPADRRARMWGWADLAERSFAALPAEDRALLEAYAAGVNAWLKSPQYRRPPEMRILHVSPEPWRASDAFMAVYNMHMMLRGNGSEQVKFELMGGSAPDPAVALRILSEMAPDGPTILSATGESSGTRGSGSSVDGTFSDSWVVSGDHTITGLPLLANDPHLAVGLPGIWQIQHHTLAGRRMAGGTLPGFPAIVVGHNGAVAWAVTNSTANTMDATLLEVEAPDGLRYRTGPDEAWQEFEVREEVFRVRFGSDVTEGYRTTPTGIVWPESVPIPPLQASPELTIELVDLAIDVLNEAPTALMGITHANTVEEAIDAVQTMTFPVVNVSFADTAGNIGYALTGRIPVRSEESAQEIAFATWDSNERTYLDPEANPRFVNPASGRIVTANQRIATEDEFPIYLSDHFAPGYRAARIHEALDATVVHDMASFVRMQGDALSPQARELTPLMLQAEPASAEDQALLDVLAEWDYRFTPDSPAPLVWTLWARELIREGLDEVGVMSSVRSANLFGPLVVALGGEEPDLCDRMETDPAETCAELLTETLTAARRLLESGWGPQAEGWRWRNTEFQLPHAGFAGLPVLGERFSRTTPIPGGPGALFTNTFIVGDPGTAFPSLYTSSYQGVYDLSDLDASLFMGAGGPSGHVGSDFYNNLTPLWVAGERMRLDPDEIEPMATLRLVPSSR